MTNTPASKKRQKGLSHYQKKHTFRYKKSKSYTKTLKEDLEFIAQRIAKYANKKRSEGLDLRKGGMVYLLRKNIKTKRPSDKLNHTKLRPFKI